jgi:hypothetical protein
MESTILNEVDVTDVARLWPRRQVQGVMRNLDAAETGNRGHYVKISIIDAQWLAESSREMCRRADSPHREANATLEGN